jgi:hypothetical protein
MRYWGLGLRPDKWMKININMGTQSCVDSASAGVLVRSALAVQRDCTIESRPKRSRRASFAVCFTQHRKVLEVASLAKDSTKFYHKLKQFAGVTNKVFSPAIDGKHGEEAASCFSSSIQSDQNATVDKSESDRLANILTNVSSDFIISPHMVDKAINRLKSGKTDTNRINSSVIKML